MRPSLPAALLAVVLLHGLSTLAWSQPFPPNCTLPPVIRLVGRTTGTADPSGLFSVVVRDAANMPIPGVTVTVDFTACTQAALAAPNCPGIVTAVTDLAGSARFTVMGSVVSRSAVQPGAPCAAISAGPVALGNVRVSAYDQDGVNGLRAIDVSLVQCDFVSGLNNQRSDFNGDGMVSAADLSLLIAAYAGGGSEATAPRCAGPDENVAEAPVGGLGLRWGDCLAGGGAATRAFACGVNTGFDELVASLVAPAGINQLLGFEAVVEIIGAGGFPLADWWRFDTPGCRSAGLQVTSAPGTGTCAVENLSAGAIARDYPSPPAANRERLRVVGLAGGPVALTPGTDYELFRLRINHQKTVGAGSCAGCAAPVEIILKSIRLEQGTCADPLLGTSTTEGVASHIADLIVTEPNPYVSNLALWQGQPQNVVGTPGNGPGIPTLATGSNPGRGPVTLDFTLPRAAQGSLAIYDIVGRTVRSLRNGMLEAGAHRVTWDGREDDGAEASAGVYVVRLKAGDISLTRTLVRLK
jgi:flagellar hook capping protein FlgD